MAFFLLEHKEGGGQRMADAMVVSAADATNAKAIAKNQYGGSRSDWDNADVTTLADILSSTASALLGYKWTVTVATPAGVVLERVSFTADATDDQLDEVGAALVVLLNATASIAAAAYAANILTVAAISDDLGDHTLTMKVEPPVINFADGNERKSGNEVMPGFVGTIVDEGIAAAVLTVAFPIDGYIVPTVIRDFYTNS